MRNCNSHNSSKYGNKKNFIYGNSLLLPSPLTLPNLINQQLYTMRIFLLTAAFIFSFAALHAQTENAKLKITPLTGNFYIYTTYNTYEQSKVPANGMYVVTNDGVVLFDTPWDTTQFQPLLDSIKMRHNKKVIICFATHWHSDKTAGLEYYRQLGIATYTTALTDELSKQNNKKRAEFLMTKDTVFRTGEYSFETFYPGEGHTKDNIVVWFNNEKILFGGCLIKGVTDKTLGFLGDGNTKAYETTLENVQKKFANPTFIVVAHTDPDTKGWNSPKSLSHSIKMAKKLKKQNKGK